MQHERVPEGFLCPHCKKDCGSTPELFSHVKVAHGGLDFDSKGQPLPASSSPPTVRFVQPQVLGQTNNLLKEFQQHRRARRPETTDADISRSILRLKRLLATFEINDRAERRRAEQKIVYWEDDKKRDSCCRCGSKLMSLPSWKRKHHCRICGLVVCDDCLTDVDLDGAVDILKRSNVDVSTAGAGKAASGSLKVCTECQRVFQLSIKQMEDSSSACKKAALYASIVDLQRRIEASAATYMNLHKEVVEGFSFSLYNEAKAAHENTVLLGHKLPTLADRLLATAQTETEQRLYKSVKQTVTTFLQQEVIALPTLPKISDLEKLKAQRSAALHAQTELERADRRKELTKMQSAAYESTVVRSAVNVANSDPFLIQMENLRNYIQAAREQGNFDEVAALEKNLRELQEYYGSQKATAQR